MGPVGFSPAAQHFSPGCLKQAVERRDVSAWTLARDSWLCHLTDWPQWVTPVGVRDHITQQEARWVLGYPSPCLGTFPADLKVFG